MDYVASLDIGNERMTMALGERVEDGFRLLAVEVEDAGGVKDGRLTDKERAKEGVRHLLERFKCEHRMNIDSLNVALPDALSRRVERKETESYGGTQTVKERRLDAMQQRCRVAAGGEEVVDVLPVGYWLDGKFCSRPVGRVARQLEARYRVYSAPKSVLDEWRALFASLGVMDVTFYPMARVYLRALSAEDDDRAQFAVVNLGAEHIAVMVMAGGFVVYEATLPLGCRAIDLDIDKAFGIQDVAKARALREKHGRALRAECKNQKVMIPDTRYSIECHDLVFVEQCRLEELLEGAVYQMQQSGVYETLEDGIYLTGEGSRIRDIDVLLERLSGLSVQPARVQGIRATDVTLLEDPDSLTALGLLLCHYPVPKKPGRIETLFGGIFGS